MAICETYPQKFSLWHVSNNNTSLDNINSVQIMYVAAFLLVRQNLSNGSTLLVSNERLCYMCNMLILSDLVGTNSQLTAVLALNQHVHTKLLLICGHTHQQALEQSTQVFSAKMLCSINAQYFYLFFSSQQFPAIQYIPRSWLKA